jgi:hypothetical protein
MTDQELVDKYCGIVGTGFTIWGFPPITPQLVESAMLRLQNQQIIRNQQRIIDALPVKDFYTPDEVMKITGQGKTKIYEALSTGKLVGTKSQGSSKWKITPEALADNENK